MMLLMMWGRHTDTQRLFARKAKALGNDAGPRHHDRRAVHNGRFAPERIFVEELVKIETAERGAFLRGRIRQIFVLFEARCVAFALLPWWS